MNQCADANWCVFRRIGSGYQLCIVRVRTRSEAERYYVTLKRLMPNAELTLAYSNEDLHKSLDNLERIKSDYHLLDNRNQD